VQPADILYVSLDAEWRVAPQAAEQLTLAGHRVIIVPHGAEALIALATRPMDLLVVEVLDVVRHGGAFARIVRERPVFQSLPMIALTQELPLADQAGLLLAGYDQVLIPTHQRHTLNHLVSPWLRAEATPMMGLLQAWGAATREALSQSRGIGERGNAPSQRPLFIH
jgi:CheY-like chemotaxis protein